MSIKIDQLTGWKALKDLRASLRAINPSRGDNTRPVLLNAPLVSETVPTTQLPAIYIDMVGLTDITTKQGQFQSFTEDMELVLVIWGYIEEPGDKHEALLALTIDILEALWSDETRGDNAVLTNLDRVDFFESILGHDNLATVAIAVTVPFQTDRG